MECSYRYNTDGELLEYRHVQRGVRQTYVIVVICKKFSFFPEKFGLRSNNKFSQMLAGVRASQGATKAIMVISSQRRKHVLRSKVEVRVSHAAIMKMEAIRKRMVTRLGRAQEASREKTDKLCPHMVPTGLTSLAQNEGS